MGGWATTIMSPVGGLQTAPAKGHKTIPHALIIYSLFSLAVFYFAIFYVRSLSTLLRCECTQIRGEDMPEGEEVIRLFQRGSCKGFWS